MALVDELKAAGQDFEWYPTTEAMQRAVIRALGTSGYPSILDIGAGDGRVLLRFAETWKSCELFSIEKAAILRQAQPETIAPVGVDFWEQDLMSLPVDVVFCNPPYSEFEAWAVRIIDTAHARDLFLVLPRRWKESAAIAAAMKARGITPQVILQDDFTNADRSARAVIDVIRMSIGERPRWERDRMQDPFEVWFDKNIDTFDEQEPVKEYEQEARELARLHRLDSIASLVDAYNEDYARLEANYKAIFKLDHAVLKELGVDKKSVREGLQKRMAGLKNTYWTALFEHLDVLTSRLSTKTKKRFLERITKHTIVAFTSDNAYAVTLWAIKFANRYFDEQLVDLFKELSTREGVLNYKSNVRTWKQDGWRYNARDNENSHYALDYRIVVDHYAAIAKADAMRYEYPGGLHTSAHELIDDCVAVFTNLGFVTRSGNPRALAWVANSWHDWRNADGETLFQVKAFMNGNVHLRFMPRAIKALNIEAGRLLGWLRSADEAVAETGCTPEEAREYFGSNQRLDIGAVKLLGPAPAAETPPCDRLF